MSIIECCGVCPPRPEVWGRRVLIVNSDLAKAHSLLFELEAAGAEVIVVESIAQALTVCASFNPDVLISKLPFADNDSISLIDKLKRRVAKQGKKILSISIEPFAWVTAQNYAIKEKFQHCIVEPFSAASVTDQVKDLLGSKYNPV